ncbi:MULTISPECIES: hypothetical protein [Kitasatospora]|uniref:hypothetical protein n=1 Tax=Kitasatospora TaxID=2063 RepID=UPI000A5BD3F6|nr:hypothetical protein [Kitasatospora sp. NRRL B-11411]
MSITVGTAISSEDVPSVEGRRRMQLTVEQFPAPAELAAKGSCDCGCGSWESCASEDCE